MLDISHESLESELTYGGLNEKGAHCLLEVIPPLGDYGSTPTAKGGGAGIRATHRFNWCPVVSMEGLPRLGKEGGKRG